MARSISEVSRLVQALINVERSFLLPAGRLWSLNGRVGFSGT